MGYLEGLKSYIEDYYETSVFKNAFEDQQVRQWFVHSGRLLSAKISGNQTYDVMLDITGQGEESLPKIDIKMVCGLDDFESVRSLLKIDKKVRAEKNEPIISLKLRHFVKNKTLYTLMMDMEVVFITLLEGEIVRGLIGGFSRYEILVHLKGGIPLFLFRHNICNLINKKGRCQLKSSQQTFRDWEKSKIYREDSIPVEAK